MVKAKYLVQIYAKDTDGDLCIGTGYSIGNGLIITARHVVLASNRAEEPELTLVWSEQDDHEVKFTDNDIIYNDGKEIDVAVIRCPKSLPFTLPEISYLSCNPKPDISWSTRGYLHAGKEDGERNDKGIAGKVAGIKESIIELDSTSSVTKEEGWGGLSGSPVLINEKLAAIIVSRYTTMENRLESVSIPFLLKQPNFIEAIRLTPTKKIPREKGNFKSILAKKISRELQRPDAKPLLDGLEDELEINEDSELDKLKALTDELLSLETDDAINNYLTYVTKDCIEKNGDRYEESQGSIPQIKKVAEEILGWLVLSSVDEDEIVRLLPSIEAESLYFVLGHTTLGAVELALSRRFQHQTRWERSKDVHQTGEYHIPVEPSYFTDDDQVEINKLLLAVWNAVVGCEEQKKGNLSSNDIKQLNAKIKRLRKDKRSPRHHYFAFDTDSIDPSRSQEIFSQLLSSDYLHEMTVVEMGSDQGSKVLLVDEFDIIEAISGFYEMIRNGDSSHKNTENKETTSA